MKQKRTQKMKLNRETLRRLGPDELLQAAGATATICYPPTFAPTCYDGCATASCPGICN